MKDEIKEEDKYWNVCYNVFEYRNGDLWEVDGRGIKFKGDFCNYIVGPKENYVRKETYDELKEEIERIYVELQQVKEKNKKEDPMEYYRQYARNKEK